MKLYVINLLNVAGYMSYVSDFNKVLTFFLIVTAIMLNVKKLMDKNDK